MHDSVMSPNYVTSPATGRSRTRCISASTDVRRTLVKIRFDEYPRGAISSVL